MEQANPSEISTQPINTLIFNELTKRRFSQEGEIRVWNVADSKLWYLTPSQAQGFLDLEDNESYRRSITDPETDLLVSHTPGILQKLKGSHYNMIDLGCGDGSKAALLIEKVRDKIQVRYCPIDISSYMVNSAAQAIRALNMGDVLQFHWNISDFENLNNITPLLREGEFQSHLQLLLGNTMGNFDRDDILDGIRQSMNENDVLLIGNGLNTFDEAELVKPYKDHSLDEFLIHVIEQIGLAPDEVEYDARYKNSRVEMYYRVKTTKTVNHLSKSVDFKAGDEILVAISYKFTKDQLDQYLKKFFGNVTIYTDDGQSYALALCTL